MWQLYVFSALAGLIGANGVPHFVKGVSGQKHQTPFGQPSSSVVNAFWGWLNLVVAGGLFYYSKFHAHPLRALVLVAAGSLVTSLVLANHWAKHPEMNK